MIKGRRCDTGTVRRFDSTKTLVLVSDTHGLLRDSAIEALRRIDPDLIVHAGDVGPRSLLERLEAVAPVVAVRGNVDRELASLPATELISINDRLIYVLHDLERLDLDPVSAEITMVISGHSHQPKISSKRGVLYINPGSIGPRRFHFPISFVKVAWKGSEFVSELIYLEEEISR